MKLLSLLFALIITPQLPVYAGVKAKAPIVNGNIQFHANCIQCGGRFVCGATDQNVKLKYLRNYETLSIQEHCYKKSHDISESIRINQNPRTEEAVRYQDYFSQIVLPINENKGGKLLYKQEKGFLYADLFRFTEPTKGLSKSQRKQVIQKARKKVSEMKKDRVLLPVVSMQDYRDLSGNRDRIDIEYQEYVKNLLLLHPSELEERPVGTGIFVKAVAIDEKLKSKFAANFGARATGAANLAGGGSGGAPGSGGEEQQGAQKRGIASKAGSDTIELDENLNVINAKTQKQKNAKEQEAASRALLQKALNEQAKVSVRKLPNFSTSGFKPSTYSYNRNIQSAYDFIAEINRSGDNSLCDVGSTSASQNTIASGSAKVAAAYGADSGLENGSLVAPKIQSTASSALSASSSDECRFKLKSIFNTPEDFRLIAGVEDDAKSAEQVVAQQERQRERGSSLFGGGSRSRSVASTSTPESGELDLDVEIDVVPDSTSSLALASLPTGLAGDGNLPQISSGTVPKAEKDPKLNPGGGQTRNEDNDPRIVKIGGYIAKVTCTSANWVEEIIKLSSSNSLTCKQWEATSKCKEKANHSLKDLCKTKLGLRSTNKCMDKFRSTVVRDSSGPAFFYNKKHPILKRFTPRRVSDGKNISNSLWDTVLLLPETSPSPDELRAAKQAICSFNKSIPRSLLRKNLSVFNSKPPVPAVTDEELFYLLDQNPQTKQFLMRTYGSSYKERVKDMSLFSMTCNQAVKIIENDIRQLELAKNDIKKAIMNSLKSHKKNEEENLSWKDLRKMITSFNLEMSLRNNGAFGEYLSANSEPKKYLPLSYGFINNLRKFEQRGCENNKINPRQTAQTN